MYGVCEDVEMEYYLPLARRWLATVLSDTHRAADAAEQLRRGLEEAYAVRHDAEIGHLHRLRGETLGALQRFDEAETEHANGLAHEAVFGDVRYRGRVERILRSQAAASYGSAPSRNDGAEDASARPRPSSDLELFCELVERAERCLLDGEAPSLSEIERLMRVKRAINSLETIEWARRRGRGK
jgi:hypothetical protein